MDIEDFDDYELQEELESRGYVVYEEDEVDEEDVYDKMYNKVFQENFILPHMHSGNDLREHLLNIISRGHYLSDDEILSTLKQQLQ